MNWRKPGFFAAGMVVVALVAGAIYVYLAQPQPVPPSEELIPAPTFQPPSPPNSTQTAAPTATEAVSASDEEQIQTAVNSTVAERMSIPSDKEFKISKINSGGEWATIDGYIAYKATGTPVPTGGILVLAHKVSGFWSLAFKGTSGYNDWLDLIPPTLITPEIKPLLK